MMNKDKPSLTAKGKPRLQLKGRIYMANVTDIVWLQKPGEWPPRCPSDIKLPLPNVATRSLSYPDLLEGRSRGGG